MCTRVFWPDNGVARVVARTMDWSVSDEPRLWVLPAGLHRSGGHPGAIEWESRHGSVVLSMFEAGTSEGVNEAGLGVHALYLDEAQYVPAGPTADGARVVANALWAQWVLDSFATVAEAVAGMDGLEISAIPVREQDLLCHLALEDASGDSAIVEPMAGGLQVHHDRAYTVMANSPPYAEQLANLRRYEPFGGTEHLPGDITSIDRFVRATYFLEHLPPPSTYGEALAGVVHIASNVSVPPGAPYDRFGVYPTRWISAADLTTPTFYFWSRLSPAMIWVELASVDLSVGAPIRVLSPEQPELVGSVTDRLQDAEGGLPF